MVCGLQVQSGLDFSRENLTTLCHWTMDRKGVVELSVIEKV